MADNILSKHVYAWKNKKLGVYYIPMFNDFEPKVFGAQVKRGLALDPKNYDNIKGLELYYLGQYDDLKGKFVLADSPVFVLDADGLAAQMADLLGLEKGEDEHGSKEVQ